MAVYKGLMEFNLQVMSPQALGFPHGVPRPTPALTAPSQRSAPRATRHFSPFSPCQVGPPQTAPLLRSGTGRPAWLLSHVGGRSGRIRLVSQKPPEAWLPQRRPCSEFGLHREVAVACPPLPGPHFAGGDTRNATADLPGFLRERRGRLCQERGSARDCAEYMPLSRHHSSPN